MAVPLANNFSLSAPGLTASVSKTSNSPEFKTLALQFQQIRTPHLFCRPNFELFPLNSSPISRRRSFKSFLTVKESDVETSDEDEVRPNGRAFLQSDADQESSSTLKSLLPAYRKAILDGDDKTTTDLEATICLAESEKNEVMEKVAALTAEITSGKEKYIRLQADFDNFRKRSEQERFTVRSDAQGEVIEKLLPMIDNFERAKQQLKVESEKEKLTDASYQGIYKQFVEIMKSLRVSVVPTVGKPFDPSVHEAIAREESPEFNEGIIMQEFRRGFLLEKRLLRPAMVKVSAGPGQLKRDSSGQESTKSSPQESTDYSTELSNRGSTEQPQAAA